MLLSQDPTPESSPFTWLVSSLLSLATSLSSSFHSRQVFTTTVCWHSNSHPLCAAYVCGLAFLTAQGKHAQFSRTWLGGESQDQCTGSGQSGGPGGLLLPLFPDHAKIVIFSFHTSAKKNILGGGGGVGSPAILSVPGHHNF